MKAILLLAGLILVVACDDDEEPGPGLTGESKTYTLGSVSNPDVSGTVKFEERDDDQIVITIDLDGTQSGGSHPAHIHANSAAEGGGIVLDLNSVDGATGMSETIVSTLNDGTPITYDELLEFNGHVNVHESSTNLATLIAQGDIGGNELTDESINYTLNEVDAWGVTGTATFTRRANGNAVVTLQLEGTAAGGDHPAHIHNNDAATGGGIAIDLNNVDGETGRSITNVTQTNDGTAITYAQLVDFNGHINVHLSPDQLSVIVVQGNIGANAE